jgi:predicted DsbA family dithiol-disulfide isomerase
MKMLAAIAGRVGLDPAQALEILESGCFAQEVRRQQAHWLDKDVHAVPMFYFNDGFAIPGAQEVQTFIRVLEKVREKTPLPDQG